MRSEPFSFRVETFERFMLDCDSIQFPMSFAFEMDFDQPLVVSRLESAVSACAALHPLLFSQLSHDGLHWNFDPSRSPHAIVGDPFQSMAIDLKSSNGLRIVIPAAPDRNRIAFIFHHGCVDGLGALQFIRDVASAYAKEGNVRHSSPSTGSPSADAIGYLNRFRNSAGRNRLLHFLRWPLDLAGMPWSMELVLNRPAPIEPEKTVVRGPRNVPSRQCQKRIYSREDSARIRRLARASGQTINDRVMEAFFLAIDDWNVQFHPANAGRLIRLIVPMSLRGKPSKSAANMVAMVNFDRRAGRWRSPKWFRRILKAEMSAVKFFRAGVMANRYLWLQKRIVGRWPVQVTADRCFASCLISNLGNLAQHLGGGNTETAYFGELRLQGFRVTAPLQPHSNVFASLFSLEQRLNIDVTFNPSVLNAAHVDFLLNAAERHLFRDD